MRTRVGLFTSLGMILAGRGLPEPPKTPDNPEGKALSRDEILAELKALIVDETHARPAVLSPEIEQRIVDRASADTHTLFAARALEGMPVIRVLPPKAPTLALFRQHIIPRDTHTTVAHTVDNCPVCKHLGMPTLRIPPLTVMPRTGPLEPELREILRDGDIRAYLTGERWGVKPRRDKPRYMLPLLTAAPAPGWRRETPAGVYSYSFSTQPARREYGALKRFDR